MRKWGTALALGTVALGTFLFAFLETSSPAGFLAIGGVAYLTLWTIVLQTLWILGACFASVSNHMPLPYVWVDSAWLFVASLGVGVVVLFWVLLVPNNEHLRECLGEPLCGFRAVLAHGIFASLVLAAPYLLRMTARPTRLNVRMTIFVTEVAITLYLLWYAGLYFTQGHFVYSMRSVARSATEERFMQLAAIAAFLIVFHIALVFIAKIQTRCTRRKR